MKYIKKAKKAIPFAKSILSHLTLLPNSPSDMINDEHIFQQIKLLIPKLTTVFYHILSAQCHFQAVFFASTFRIYPQAGTFKYNYILKNTVHFKVERQNYCIVRESNPGQPHGRRAFYH